MVGGERDEDRVGRIRAGVRTVGGGFAAATAVTWLAFSASRGTMEVLVLLLATGLLGWFATADLDRLADRDGRLNRLAFGVAGAELLLVLGSAVVLGTGTLYLGAVVALTAPVVGLVRTYRGSGDGAR